MSIALRSGIELISLCIRSDMYCLILNISISVSRRQRIRKIHSTSAFPPTILGTCLLTLKPFVVPMTVDHYHSLHEAVYLLSSDVIFLLFSPIISMLETIRNPPVHCTKPMVSLKSKMDKSSEVKGIIPEKAAVV